jgi:hypothetical protein
VVGWVGYRFSVLSPSRCVRASIHRCSSRRSSALYTSSSPHAGPSCSDSHPLFATSGWLRTEHQKGVERRCTRCPLKASTTETRGTHASNMTGMHSLLARLCSACNPTTPVNGTGKLTLDLSGLWINPTLVEHRLCLRHKSEHDELRENRSQSPGLAPMQQHASSYWRCRNRY